MEKKKIIIIIVSLLVLIGIFYFLSANTADKERDIEPSSDQPTEDIARESNKAPTPDQVADMESRALQHVAGMDGLADSSNPQILSSRHGLDGCPECTEYVIRTGSGQMATDIIVEINGEEIEAWITK